jgi:hypothetical protein|tara:strand:+ start:411 stop:860 length:450 start_codon:yes stop_codon:yes gene_type:complete
MKTKLKDTKVGQFLKTKAPKILDVIGDVLPDSGSLGIVKNLISKDPDLTPEEKAELHAQVVEVYKLEVEDRDSARNREIEVAKVKKFDLMFNLTGIVGLASFSFLVYAIVYLNIPENNKEIWIHLIGITEGITISLFGYFYGSAMRDKK